MPPRRDAAEGERPVDDARAAGYALALIGGQRGVDRDPTVAPVDDPTRGGPLVEEMMRTARTNAGLDGKDLD